MLEDELFPHRPHQRFRFLLVQNLDDRIDRHVVMATLVSLALNSLARAADVLDDLRSLIVPGPDLEIIGHHLQRLTRRPISPSDSERFERELTKSSFDLLIALSVGDH